MKVSAAIASSLIALLAASASAHHSRAMFDESKQVRLEGVVKEFQYSNPHSWLIVDVRGPDGKVTTWGFETLAPSSLMRLGISRGDFVPGAKVIVSGHPMKDGRTAASFIQATRADGKVITIRSGPDAATPQNAYAAGAASGNAAAATPASQPQSPSQYTDQEKAALAVANGFWDNVFQARNPERAKDYLAVDYVDHNPNLRPGGGLPAFVEFLTMVRKRFPMPEGVKPPSDIVLTLVDGEFVTFVRKRTSPHPNDTAKSFDAFNFETFRVRGGKIVEHWDGAWSTIGMPGGAAPARPPGTPK